MLRPAVLRAVNRSITIAFVILALVTCLAVYETLFVAPGAGYLNSDIADTGTQDDKLKDILRGLMILPLELAALAAVFFLVQLPFLGTEP